MTTQRFKVLFLCTGNSARSIMAESICSAFKGEQIIAQPLVIALLAVPILIQAYFNSGLATATVIAKPSHARATRRVTMSHTRFCFTR